MPHNESSVSIKELQQASKFIDQLQRLANRYPKFRPTAQCACQKDPQQKRVYGAEGRHSEWRCNRFVAFGELEHFVKTIEASVWYRARVGNRSIEVGRGADDDLAARGGLFYISIPPIHRRKMVVLHEVAHAIYWRPGSAAQDHGPNFCRVYLELVEKFIGVPAALELVRLFKSKGVKVSRARTMKLIRFRGTEMAPWKAVFAGV